MKEVAFQDDMIKFSIPKNWIADSAPDGSGVFYEDGPETGTLQLNIITARSPKPISDKTAFEELTKLTGDKAESIEQLPNGNALSSSVRRDSEQGKPMTVFWWYLANTVRPDKMRLALFSYTVASAQETSTATKRDVQMIADSIKNAKFRIGE